MRAVKGAGTGPERAVRAMLHRLGYRFRLNRRDLPGSPDIVLPRLKTSVFVHGCFWHGHVCARGARTPKTNRAFWVEKIARNRARDARVRRELRALGWRSLVVWECALRDPERLSARLRRSLG